MRYLIDGYNLLFHFAKLRKPFRSKRLDFLLELNDAIAAASATATVIFDGAEEHLPYTSQAQFDALTIVYTSKHQSADDFILEWLSSRKIPSAYTIVTNDRSLATRCKALRANVRSIEAFISFLKKKIDTARIKKCASTQNSFQESPSEITRLLEIFEKNILEKGDQDL